jgi:pseudouridine-5'-phosphate glycosidase/pseudouridine kinase
LSAMEEEGLDTTGIVSLPIDPKDTAQKYHNRTAQYIAINDINKDLFVAMADMSIFERQEPSLDLKQSLSSKLKWMVVDGNWPPLAIASIISQARSFKTKIAFEPVSVAKSAGLFQPSSGLGKGPGADVFPKHIVDLATPNQQELAAMYDSARTNSHLDTEKWWEVIDSLGIPSSGARDRFVALTNHRMTDEGIPLRTIQLLPYIPTILTKLGRDGVLLTELLKPDDERLTNPDAAPYILSRSNNGSTEVGGVYMRLFPAVEVVKDVVSVNGVGDTFLGVLIAGLAQGLKLDERLIDIAQRGAVMTLRSKDAVSPDVALLKTELAAL